MNSAVADGAPPKSERPLMPHTKPRLGRPPKAAKSSYTSRVAAMIREDTGETLRELADAKNQSISDYVRRVLESHVRSVQAGRAASKQSQGE